MNNRIESYLADIEQELNNGKNSLFGKGILVNKDDLLSLTAKIRQELLVLTKEAEAITETKDKVFQECENKISESRKLCQDIVQSAKEKAEEILNSDVLLLKAKEEAKRLIDEAVAYRKQVDEIISCNMEELLSNCENNLTKAVKIVKEARNENAKVMAKIRK